VKKEKLQPPDLVLIDGGRGQLNAALEALDEIGFRGEVEVAGLAKRLEEVFARQCRSGDDTENIGIPETVAAGQG
jgi:excinuclease UvrABC nuclease subunit